MNENHITITEGSGNVFLDLGFEPAEAEVMKLRTEVMIRTAQQLKERGWTQAEAARQLGITQPRVSRLLKGKIEDFSLDMLLTLAARSGLHAELRMSAWSNPSFLTVVKNSEEAIRESLYKALAPGSKPRYDTYWMFTEQFREPNTPFLSPTQVVEFFGLRVQKLAERARVHCNTPTARPHTPQLQEYLQDMLLVLTVATEITGDAERVVFRMSY